MKKEIPKRVKSVVVNWEKKLQEAITGVAKGKRPPESMRWTPFYDIADHISVCKLILKGEYEEASDLVDGLDTASRDEVPSTVYDWLDNI